MEKYLLAGENKFTCGRKICCLREKNYFLAGEYFVACGRKFCCLRKRRQEDFALIKIFIVFLRLNCKTDK